MCTKMPCEILLISKFQLTFLSSLFNFDRSVWFLVLLVFVVSISIQICSLSNRLRAMLDWLQMSFSISFCWKWRATIECTRVGALSRLLSSMNFGMFRKIWTYSEFLSTEFTFKRCIVAMIERMSFKLHLLKKFLSSLFTFVRFHIRVSLQMLLQNVILVKFLFSIFALQRLLIFMNELLHFNISTVFEYLSAFFTFVRCLLIMNKNMGFKLFLLTKLTSADISFVWFFFIIESSMILWVKIIICNWLFMNLQVHL